MIKTTRGGRPHGVWVWLGVVAIFCVSLVSGCGDDVTKITQVTEVTETSALEMARMIEPEQCIVCHKEQGQKHQDIYNQYKDASAFGLSIDSVTSSAGYDDGSGNTVFDVTLDFSITKKDAIGVPQPYIDLDELPSLDQKSFYATIYNSTTGEFLAADNFSWSSKDVVSNDDGSYSVVATAKPFAPELSNAMVYSYIADGELDTEGMTLYGDVANTAAAFGDAGSYASTANVEACEGCHGKPYLKHGYRAAEVVNLGDFTACKNCHLDDKAGSHPDWQLLADDPEQYAAYFAMIDPSSKSTDAVTDFMTTDEKTRYGYTRKLMNDVHMSHSMEFPFPQSMKNCSTCHEGKLDQILTDDNFRLPVCKSCHAIAIRWKDDADHSLGVQNEKALNYLANLKTFDNHPDLEDPLLVDTNCAECHKDPSSVPPPTVMGAPTFTQLHNGFDSKIYAYDIDSATGTRYTDAFAVTIEDGASYDSATNKVTFTFKATESTDIPGLDVTQIKPQVMVGLYGYDTKDFGVVYTHGSDFDDDGDGVVGVRNKDFTNLEYTVGSVHPRFTTDSTTDIDASNREWTVTVDLSAWKDKLVPDADGVIVIRRIELAVRPVLETVVGQTLDDDPLTPTVIETKDVKANVALVAPSRTFDLGTDGFDDAFYADIVDVAGGCNNCHDALATTFHSADRGGNIKVCRMCHSTLAGGSHLELQSRSIDSYVHAVHSFAPFDPGDVDFSDPVAVAENGLHLEHTFPNFTIKNCEACHVPGSTFMNPPDQSKSLPGILSGTDPVAGRSLGDIESVVTGPGARACGACHRQEALNEANDNKLVAVNAHTKLHGYSIPVEAGVLDAVIDRILTLFN